MVAVVVPASPSVTVVDPGTMTAGQETSDVIPGMKITAAGVLIDGAEDTFSITVTNKGVGVGLNDYLLSLTDRTGYFADRKTGDDAITKSFMDRVGRMDYDARN